MATRNRKWFDEYSEKYGVKYQVVKGNDITVHVAIIGKERHTALAQLNKSQTEALFKRISEGKAETTENTVAVTCTGKVSLNGTRHYILDVLRGVSVRSLVELMETSRGSHAYYGIGEWLMDWNNRLAYVQTIETDPFTMLEKMLLIGAYLQTGKTKFKLEEVYEMFENEVNEWNKLEGVL